MTRFTILAFSAILQFLVIGSVLAIPKPADPPSTTTPSQDLWKWFWISGDGSQVIPVTGPQATPPNIAGAANGHSYTFGFNNFHGAQIPQPGLAKFLFECEFGLFDKVPASGQGVWTPSPAGKYACNGNVPNLSTTLRIALAANPIGWKMAYHDLAFLIKVLHDTQGVEKESPFFDFAFNYTPDVGRVPYARVANGEFVRSFGNGGVTTS